LRYGSSSLSKSSYHHAHANDEPEKVFLEALGFFRPPSADSMLFQETTDDLHYFIHYL
jgi:hypothetical protein